MADPLSEAQEPTPAGDRTLRGRDIVCFSNDWNGVPLSKAHLMRGLARDNRVLWINSVGNRSPKASARDFGRLASKLRQATSGLVEVEANLFVLSPLCLPYYRGALVRGFNGAVLGAQVRHAMGRLGFERPISWSFLPAAANVVGRLGERLILYHCVDDFTAFSDTPVEAIADLEASLCRRADLVVVSAEKLLVERRHHNPATVLVRHGVDHRHFAQALEPALAIASELVSLPRPVLGFFGLIADWVDLDLVAAVARRWSHGSVVLVGEASTELTAVAGLPNVHLLGRRPYAALPGFCKGFDVALMPFRVNPLTLASNPLKVREYLAAGLPVVSTAIPEVERLGLCRIGRDPEGFLQEIQAALAEGAGPSAARSRAVASESWEARLAEIRAHVRRIEAQRGA